MPHCVPWLITIVQLFLFVWESRGSLHLLLVLALAMDQNDTQITTRATHECETVVVLLRV